VSTSPSPEFFRLNHKLPACELGEPSLTLVRNDPDDFGLLIASGAHYDSGTGRLHIDNVIYLHISGQRRSYKSFESVAVFHENELWFAQDPATSCYFPYPSQLPYHMAFISDSELRRIRAAWDDGLSYPVFEIAQRHFGQLPGFATQFRILQSPADYATERDAIPESKYVTDTITESQSA